MQLEQLFASRGRPVATWGAAGRLWTAAWILVPLPILFHPPFVAGIILPLIDPASPTLP
jgi:alginate O-acetyltransferase complex protein AlgI